MKPLLDKSPLASQIGASIKANTAGILTGIGVGITTLAFVVATVPGFYPEGYERAGRMGLRPLFFLFFIISIVASFGYLYADKMDKEQNDE